MAADLIRPAARIRGLPLSQQSASVWAAGVSLALLLGLLASTSRSWAAPVAAVAVLAVGAYYTRALGLRVGLVLLLIVTATADRYTFQVGSFSVRAEQVAALAALAALIVSTIQGGRWKLLKPDLAEALLLAWFACNVLSSLLASPDRRLSAKILALFAVCSLGLFLPRRLLAGPGGSARIETVASWLLLAFATETAYATIAYLVHVLGPTVSLGLNPASGHLSGYGTLWEQNVLGAYAAAGLVAWAYLGPSRYRRAWLGMAICMGGLAASLTRAAWLAAAATCGLVIILPSLRRRLEMKQMAKGAVASLFVIGAILILDRSGKYSVPLPNIDGPTSGGAVGGGGGGFLSAVLNRVDVVGRFNQVALVSDDIRNHLLFGRGTAGFEALHQVKGLPEHLASLPLNVLDGTGVLGLAIFVAFVIAVFARAWRRRGHEVVLALGQVALVILITNLATETLELMIGWLLVGLLLASTDVASETPPQPAEN